jgi:oxygen-independent coproporphyrinogen-3 oxidase
LSGAEDRGATDLHQAFAVYVHWPFCAQKCPYCDFNSHVRHDGWDEDTFLAAYLAELRFFAAQIDHQDVTSVFFGGGTPSLMKPSTTAAIIGEIARLWTMARDCEITLEANPGSVDAGRFAEYRAAGVNRVSLGVQSLRDEALQRLGRVHSAREALRAIDVARSTFKRWSIDLIYARPGQTVPQWRAELAEALALGPRHVSLYQLTIEEGTPFAALHRAGKLVVPPDDDARALYEATQELCEAAGLPQYEISNHAVPGEECRHNLVYWHYGAYAGIGPGAHGRVMIGGRRHATVGERSPEGWAGRVQRDEHGLVERTALTGREEAEEALLMGLRLAQGIPIERISALAGAKVDIQVVEKLAGLGLVHAPRPGHVQVTPAGRMVLNVIVAEIASRL